MWMENENIQGRSHSNQKQQQRKKIRPMQCLTLKKTNMMSDSLKVLNKQASKQTTKKANSILNTD